MTGYISLSEDNIFEVALRKEDQQKGFGIEATILFFNYFFETDGNYSEIYTFVHISNIYSMRCAVSFGWVRSSKGRFQEWSKYTPRKDDYFSSIRIKKLRDRLLVK